MFQKLLLLMANLSPIGFFKLLFIWNKCEQKKSEIIFLYYLPIFSHFWWFIKVLRKIGLEKCNLIIFKVRIFVVFFISATHIITLCWIWWKFLLLLVNVLKSSGKRSWPIFITELWEPGKVSFKLNWKFMLIFFNKTILKRKEVIFILANCILF